MFEAVWPVVGCAHGLTSGLVKIGEGFECRVIVDVFENIGDADDGFVVHPHGMVANVVDELGSGQGEVLVFIDLFREDGLSVLATALAPLVAVWVVWPVHIHALRTVTKGFLLWAVSLDWCPVDGRRRTQTLEYPGPDTHGMDCIAHRGFAGVNPENTIGAIEAAVAADADGIEIDVRRCREDTLVVIHDEDVDRVTDSEGLVSAYTAGELADLSVLDSEYGIPTLAAVCAVVPPDIPLILDLKECDIAVEAASIARRHDCSVVLSSFSPTDLAAVDDVPTAFITDEAPDRALAVIQRYEFDVVHPHWHLCTATFIEALHALSVQVNVWTVTMPALRETLAPLGIDGIIVDDPSVCAGDSR